MHFLCWINGRERRKPSYSCVGIYWPSKRFNLAGTVTADVPRLRWGEVDTAETGDSRMREAILVDAFQVVEEPEGVKPPLIASRCRWFVDSLSPVRRSGSKIRRPESQDRANRYSVNPGARGHRSRRRTRSGVMSATERQPHSAKTRRTSLPSRSRTWLTPGSPAAPSPYR